MALGHVIGDCLWLISQIVARVTLIGVILVASVNAVHHSSSSEQVHIQFPQ